MSSLRSSRRGLLKAGVAVTGLAAAGIVAGRTALRPRRAVAQAGAGFVNRLAIPPLEQGRMDGGERIFDLAIQDGTSRFFPGLDTATRGINGAYLGPVLRMRAGETVRLNVTNRLSEDTTLHWHGMTLPARADGGPHQIIRAGTTWSPEYPIRERAATMWYHSHLLGATARHVWQGIAGMIVIDDAESDALALPRDWGVDDIPVVLQDRRFYEDGAMPYEEGMRDRMMGMIGNFPLINGTIAPWLPVTTQRIRLRLLNGANASIYNLRFSDGRRFHQIASDGGLLPAPVALSQLTLAPGERAEIVVALDAGKPVRLQSVAAPASRGMGRGMGMMGGMMGGGEQSPVFDMLELRPADSLAPSPALPARLADLPVPDPGTARRTRRFVLEMPMGPRMMLGGGFTINGKAMDMTRIDARPRMGEAEIWEIGNTGPMRHPFHIHDTQFRILDRDGRPPAANEAGLKDTVLVDPGETVRLLVRFDHYRDPDRPYMFHCHILEHEDAGMMGQFVVV